MTTMNMLALINNELKLFAFDDRNKANAKYRELISSGALVITDNRTIGSGDKMGVRLHKNSLPNLCLFASAILESGEDINALRDTAGHMVSELLRKTLEAVKPNWVNAWFNEDGVHYFSYKWTISGKKYYFLTKDVTREGDPCGLMDIFFYDNTGRIAFSIRDFINA